jgi:hypothetical protein
MTTANRSHQHKYPKKVLFIGHVGIGSNALSLLKGFSKVSDEINAVDTSWFDTPGKYSARRFVHHYFPFFYDSVANKILSFKILKQYQKFDPELVFISIKIRWIRSKLLERITIQMIHQIQLTEPKHSIKQKLHTIFISLQKDKIWMKFRKELENLFILFGMPTIQTGILGL